MCFNQKEEDITNWNMISRMVSVFRKKKEKKKNGKCDITKKLKKEKGLRLWQKNGKEAEI